MSLSEEFKRLQYTNPRQYTVNFTPEDIERLDQLRKALGNAPRSKVLALVLRKFLAEREAQEVEARRDCHVA
jgi:metal-responsive CopG/Arc/MetJ family transcriptional regulator